MARNKLYWKKEKDRERKKRGGGRRKQKTKNKREYPLILYIVNPSTSPVSFQHCFGQELAFPVLPAGLLGHGPASTSNADSQRCVHLGELPSPLPGAGLSGSCLSYEAPAESLVKSDSRRNNSGGGQVSSPGVSSRSNYHSSQSEGAWVLHRRAAPRAGASLLPCVLSASACPGGSARSWAASPGALGSGACAAGITLLGHAAPSKRSRRLSRSWPLRAHAAAL